VTLVTPAGRPATNFVETPKGFVGHQVFGLGGVAVNIAARVMDAAESGGIMASETVKDLVLGSNLEFINCGPFDLSDLPDPWVRGEDRAPSVLAGPASLRGRDPSAG
jgi:class 3 adenylate cyclase